MGVKKLAKQKMKRFIWNCALWAEYIKKYIEKYFEKYIKKYKKRQKIKKQARKLQATLEGCNPKLWITDWLADGGEV